MRGRVSGTCTRVDVLVYADSDAFAVLGVDLSTIEIESALFSLNDHLACELCKQSLRDRIKQLIVQWAIVKVCSLQFRDLA